MEGTAKEVAKKYPVISRHIGPDDNLGPLLQPFPQRFGDGSPVACQSGAAGRQLRSAMRQEEVWHHMLVVPFAELRRVIVRKLCIKIASIRCYKGYG